MALKHTSKGTPYLTAPEVCIIAATHVGRHVFGAESFVRELFPDTDYFEEIEEDIPLNDGAQLTKFAGQLCYLSFGAQRTRNAEASKYLEHVKANGHGSVFEHVSMSILFWGVSRAFTHELVRHRAGFGFSQVSQRYVAGKHVRFVESLATQFDHACAYSEERQLGVVAELHDCFEQWIDACREEYERREQLLLRRAGIDYKTATTDQRKAVRQEARRCLPNETEAPILVTGNIRAWRHFCEQRASEFADAETCRNAFAAFEALCAHEPMLWEDYIVSTDKRADGLPTVQTPYRKV